MYTSPFPDCLNLHVYCGPKTTFVTASQPMSRANKTVCVCGQGIKDQTPVSYTTTHQTTSHQAVSK